jgi:SAM-dependent methyltransferase
MARALLFVSLPLLALLLLTLSTRAEESVGTEEILAFLNPRRGETIADLGCGTGTWTFVLARAVGSQGRVLAVDIDPEAVAKVKEKAKAEGLDNVETFHSVPDDPRLPKNSLDAIFLNDVIDWVERPSLAGFLAGVRDALKADGRLVIRDPSGGPGRVIAELHRAGFALVEARIPLDHAPSRPFASDWYAMKLRKAEIQPSIFPRLGRPARYRTRLHLAEELFRTGLLSREELRARWEAIRDQPGPFEPGRDETRDLIRASLALGVLEPAHAERLLAGLDERD